MLHSNHRVTRRRQNKVHEKIFEEIIVENFPKMGKEIATQVKEAQSLPKRKNSLRNTTHINQTNKNQTEKTNIKSNKVKATKNIQGDIHKANSKSFNRNPTGQKGMVGHT